MEYIKQLKKIKRDISRIKKLETINNELRICHQYLYHANIFEVTRVQFLNIRALELLNEKKKPQRSEGK